MATEYLLMWRIQVSKLLQLFIDANIGNNVYVAGIPRRINEDDLKRVFGKYGQILDIKVIKDPVTTNSKGFAYILFDKVDDATRAIDCLDN